MNGGMLMRSASVVQLLKIGHFLFQRQSMLKRIVGDKYEFFKDEINSILQIILIYMGIVRGKENSSHIVNTEHYEYLANMYWSYCQNKITEEEMIDTILMLKLDSVEIYVGIGERKANLNSLDTYLLQELKDLLHIKRVKLNKFLDGLSLFIRAEMRLILLELEEIMGH